MYELEVEDTFDGDRLNEDLWLPYYLPHWSDRAAAAARFQVGGGSLVLTVDEDQPPWCPEFDGEARVSSLQTGAYAGPLGSAIGQHRFSDRAVVREEQPGLRLYTPTYGRFEARAKALDDPDAMVALWMIGYEDRPERSAEICVFEIFGSEAEPGRAQVGMGVHPFGDPRITDDFTKVPLPIDVRDFHVYAAEWSPGQVAFFVDGEQVKTVAQAPDYPMQFMLGLYDFRRRPGRYPKRFEVDYFRAWRFVH
ncbi:glycoside hydrolase family 16 protein [Streptosporangiaceae bacterium NEAU-GS5]|nr:glycoside hydrolase family 16 protein [Streptosporangiaceae bacterium NEAU-GS5]